MGFKRARKKEQIENRRQEILCAAEQLFNHGGLDDVTFSHIAKQVSFTRQTIYTYYQTREEVLLDLLGQRLEHFYQSLEAMFPGDELFTREEFCQRLAHHFIEHRETLRLFSLRHTVLEENVRYENLVAFNRIMLQVFPTVKHILRRQCPRRAMRRSIRSRSRSSRISRASIRSSSRIRTSSRPSARPSVISTIRRRARRCSSPPSSS